MNNQNSNECFVVMPFGKKPFPAEPDRHYDFDKVYRVLIQRAIREAGMKPIRADEHTESGLIHTSMFRDLRDRKVVLADLSLMNPNVYYELGCRHVMSSRGTVLICQKGSVLPFDIKLSRTIFYDFDGASLDWEEVEDVVQQLVAALTQARSGLPDSPVHALLPTVLQQQVPKGKRLRQRPEDAPDAEPLADFQEMVGRWWEAQDESLESLFETHQGSVFGSRALACLALATDPTSKVAKYIANHLNDGQQYRLANRLYQKLYDAGKLTRGSQLAFASSYSEEHPDIKGADRAIRIAGEVLEGVRAQYDDDLDNPDAILNLALCHRRLAGLRQWRWQLSDEQGDLDHALQTLDEAIRYNERARKLGILRHPGFLAQLRLKALLLLRIRDDNIDRPDVEGHHDAMLSLSREPDDDPIGSSYLFWFQAIALADMGAAEQSNQRALSALNYDADLKSDPRYWEIGGRQYVQLRRLLEQYSSYLRNQSLIGQISQILQSGQDGQPQTG